MDEQEVALKSPRMKSKDDRTTPTAIDLEAAGPRKRDRDSQFGPTTPGSDEPEPSSFTEGPLVASHTAKKGRIVSRDGSLRDVSANDPPPAGDAFAPRETNEVDPDLTPPGTPRVSSIPASPAIPHRSEVGSTSAMPTVSSNLASMKDTPPGTPRLGTNGLPVSDSGVDKPENVRVKEMRERVQDMTTDETDTSTVLPPVTSAAPSPPADSVVEEIADLPSSAAEAERQNELHHTEGDVVISECPVGQTEASGSANLSAPQVDLPAPALMTSSAVSTIQNAPRFVPPPSPASSLRAETGSSIGDTDYLDAHPTGRHSSSRMSSVSSLRGFANHQTSSSSSLSTHHLNLHSALPKSTSSSGFDTPSDALSDISTEANPPETPHPLAEVEGSSVGSGASRGTPSLPTPEVSAPPSPAAPVMNAKPVSKGPLVQANFGRPTSSFSPTAAAPPSAGGSAKTFVNPFSSFGAASASPFASSAGPSSKPGFSAAPSSSSNLSTATPVVPSFGSSLTASPFASAGSAGKSAFGNDSPNLNDDAEEGSQSETSNIARFGSPSDLQILTGEEDEYTQYQIPRAKLFVLEGTDWKERGVGQLRLNTKAIGPDDRLSARLVMRSEAVHRLILNISLFPEMNVTLAQDKFLRFSAFEEGKLQHFTIRCANSLVGKDLFENVQELRQMLPKRSKAKDGESETRAAAAEEV